MNLSGNLSSDDLDRVYDMNNPPEHAGGFGTENSSNLDDMFDIEGFDSLDGFGDDSSSGFGGSGSSVFGSGSQGSFGGNSQGGFGNNNGFGGGSQGGFGGGGNSFGSNNGFGGGNSFGSNGFGGNNSFGGGNSFGNNGFGGTFGGQPGALGGMGNMNGQVAQESEMDKMVDASLDAAKSLGILMLELFKSIKLRNIDDFGYLGTQLITVGGVLTGASIVTALIGTVSNIPLISFSGIPMNLILSGALTAGTGLVSIGTAALVLSRMEDMGIPIESVPDTDESNNMTNEFENNIGAESDDLFGDDFDDLFSDFDFSDTDTAAEPEAEVIEEISLDGVEEKEEEFVPDGLLEDIKENQVISRDLLFNTFRPMFTHKTPKFADKREIEKGSDEFLEIQAACLKSMANILGCEMEDVKSTVVSAYDSFFSYEIKMSRVKKMNKTDDLARELEIYFRSNSKETGVSAIVDMEGDYYRIIVTKGETAVITFGDIFKQQYCCDFFLNPKKKLPMITGITELGEVILDDAKVFDTMLIAGKPRSGKSWYVLSVLMSLTLFNTPEDVQFVIVDPKESNLFKTFALMPHVCGLHNDKHILEIMDDLINNEGPRRKKLLADHKVDDIWALRDKGIRLPILYLVIDEYITAKNNLGDNSKELDKKLQTIISQLPSLGVRLIFIPHRATGIVDRTNRTMIQFAACVKSDQSEVIDTLDIKKWNRPLVNPGDIAVKTSSNPTPMYVRGAALTTSDNQNTEFIRVAARAFYKIGVDLPDMSSLTIAYNRDPDYIKSELTDNTTREQFNANNILSDI